MSPDEILFIFSHDAPKCCSKQLSTAVILLSVF